MYVCVFRELEVVVVGVFINIALAAKTKRGAIAKEEIFPPDRKAAALSLA